MKIATSMTVAKRWLVNLLPLVALCAAGALADSALADDRPNILIINADDLGYGDVQCYNPERGKIPTPNMDQLAAQGMRFTDAHASASACTPSRYTLLTGRYPWRSKLQGGILPPMPTGRTLIPPERLTVAGLARQNGYRTACFGKWHLGWMWPVKNQEMSLLGVNMEGKRETIPEPPAPTAEQLAVWKAVFSQPIAGGPITCGFDRYFGVDAPNWPPFCFIENDRLVGMPSEFLPAVNFRLLDLATCQGPALKGWDLKKVLPAVMDQAVEFIANSTRAKQPFLLYLPLTSPHAPIIPNDPWKGKSGLANDYADFVMETDDAVGRVLTALEKSGASDNTVVIFTSDNGCAGNAGLTELAEKGHYPSGPLRGHKGSVYEGGHRMPFIVRWPKVVRAGAVSGQLVHHADVMATLAEILGVKLPDNAGEDSFSLLPLLKGKDTPVREYAVCCGGQGTQTLRCGSWKLVLWRDEKAGTEVQLYNLADDIGEDRNLAAQNPERIAAMRAVLEKIINDGRSNPGPVLKNDVEVQRLSVGERKKKTATSDSNH